MKKLNSYRILDRRTNKQLMTVDASSTKDALTLAGRKFPIGTFKVILVNTTLFDSLVLAPEHYVAA